MITNEYQRMRNNPCSTGPHRGHPNNKSYFGLPWLCLGTLLLVWGSGCSKDEVASPNPLPPTPKLNSDTVAIVGNRGISLESYKAALKRQANFKNKQEILDELIHFVQAIEDARPPMVVDHIELSPAFRDKTRLRATLRLLAPK